MSRPKNTRPSPNPAPASGFRKCWARRSRESSSPLSSDIPHPHARYYSDRTGLDLIVSPEITTLPCDVANRLQVPDDTGSTTVTRMAHDFIQDRIEFPGCIDRTPPSTLYILEVQEKYYAEAIEVSGGIQCEIRSCSKWEGDDED